jgi:hypothetical protein
MQNNNDNIKNEVSEWVRTVDRTEYLKWIPLTRFYEFGRGSYDPTKVAIS